LNSAIDHQLLKLAVSSILMYRAVWSGKATVTSALVPVALVTVVHVEWSFDTFTLKDRG
jgi:hypothetical protein